MNALNMEILYYKKTSEIQKHFVDRSNHPFHQEEVSNIMFKLRHGKSKKERILEKRFEYESFGEFLKSLSNSELHELGKAVVFSNWDGYNLPSCESKMCYFNNLDRWQKEFFIKQRSYCL